MVTIDKLDERLEKIKYFLDSDFITEEIFEEDLPLYLCEEKADFYAGLTKGCIDYKDLPYVIKCGLDGFDKTPYEENPVEDELYLYDVFKGAGLEAILANTWRIDDTFIGAERIIPISNFWAEEDNVELAPEEEKWVFSQYYFSDRIWAKKAVKEYGLDYLKKFINFARDFDFLSDMHKGNYGYNKDGIPKILDWGGSSALKQINA